MFGCVFLFSPECSMLKFCPAWRLSVFLSGMSCWLWNLNSKIPWQDANFSFWMSEWRRILRKTLKVGSQQPPPSTLSESLVSKNSVDIKTWGDVRIKEVCWYDWPPPIREFNFQDDTLLLHGYTWMYAHYTPFISATGYRFRVSAWYPLMHMFDAKRFW